MNWDALGAVAELLGATAVFATLVYLGKQIRQANLVGKAETEREWFASWHDLLRSTMGTEESASFMRKGLNSYASMPPNEKAAFSTNIICMFDYADVLRRLHEKGLVTEDVLNPVMLNMLGLIHTPGGAQWWEKVGPILTIYPYLTALEVDPEDVPDLLDSMDYFDPRYLTDEPGGQ